MAEQAVAALDGAQQRFDTARAAAEACVAREEADRVAARVASIDQTENELAQLTGQLAAITLTDPMLAGIEQHWAVVARIEAQLRADAAIIEFTAPADLDITVDGQARILSAGQVWTQPASAAVIVDVPGVLSVRIDPGASAVKLRADLDAAQDLLNQELQAAGVVDIAAARALAAQRRALIESRTTAAAKLEGLCGGEDGELLRTRLAELLAVAADGEQLDAEAAAAELTAANDALRVARLDADAKQKAAIEATATHTKKSTEATVLRDRRETAGAESTGVREQLAALRATVTDETVAAQAAADAEEQRRADEAVAALAERYAVADPAAVEAALAAASGPSRRSPASAMPPGSSCTR